MELRQLSTFCAVVESGSVTAASRALGYAQSTVTAQLQTLEASVGTDLFERHGKRLHLTSAGREVYDRARVVIRDVDEIREALAGRKEGVAGDVRLGSIESAAESHVSKPLATFLQDRPRVHVHFEIGSTLTLARRVAAGELDVAIACMPPTDLGLSFEPLYVERLALLVPEQSPLYGRRSVRLAEVARERMLLTQSTCSYNDAIREAAARAGVALDVVLESANIATVKRAVQLGMGAAVLPSGELERPPARTSVARIEDGRLRLAIGIVRAKRPASTVVKALAHALSNALRT